MDFVRQIFLSGHRVRRALKVLKIRVFSQIRPLSPFKRLQSPVFSVR